MSVDNRNCAVCRTDMNRFNLNWYEPVQVFLGIGSRRTVIRIGS
jgi:hypothetical protein